MLNRLRSGALAGGGALLLILSISGMAMGASLTSDSGPVDTSFVDVDGDGVADHCQTDAAAENTEAAQAAFDAADLNDDGEISVSEAAQSGWTGGVNCNHGGYVSEVAQAGDSCEAEDTEEPEGTETGTEEGTEGTEEAAPEEGTADCGHRISGRRRDLSPTGRHSPCHRVGSVTIEGHGNWSTSGTPR